MSGTFSSGGRVINSGRVISGGRVVSDGRGIVISGVRVINEQHHSRSYGLSSLFQ